MLKLVIVFSNNWLQDLTTSLLNIKATATESHSGFLMVSCGCRRRKSSDQSYPASALVLLWLVYKVYAMANAVLQILSIVSPKSQ